MRRVAPRDALVRAPVTTYRVQLNQAFGLSELEAITPYLDALGVTDCYCSPLLTATAGSTHGYDICQHSQLNRELGTAEDLRAVAATLREYGMGLVLDFVPNHMGIDPSRNVWWRDVLENGPSSLYARYFDIDWRPIKPELRDKVLLPILGDQYGLVLERGELQLSFETGALVLHYGGHVLPINPRQAPMVLEQGLDELASTVGESHPDLVELRGLLAAFSSLPATSERDLIRIAQRHREKEALRLRLAALVERSAAVRQHIERAIGLFNGEPGVAESFDRLHGFLEEQAYRLAYWRTAFDEINYRRFFDVNELAGLRMEDPQVFADTHALLLDLVGEGLVTGLRIDHPDGLFDPAAYFDALQHAAAQRVGKPGRRLYVAAEKVLGRGERLREDWAIHGTTGYGFLNTLNGLFVPPDGLSDLRRVYRRFTGYRELASDTMYASKRFVMRAAMASELTVLSLSLNRLSEGDRQWRDFTLNSLRRALLEVIACFPVYRTYVTARGASAEDIAVVDTAISEARRRNPVQEPSIFEFIRRALIPPPLSGSRVDPNRDRSVAFAHKFQQYTAPVVAKGQEDTAFYRDVLLLSANEVGGDLRHRARSVSEFHAGNLHRLSRWPYELTAGSTHDTKRGEDARARINVIAERADQWRAHLAQWAAICDVARTRIGSISAPDRNDEWMFYQSLVGAWPAEPLDALVPTAAPRAFIDRLQTFMGKAIKEGKRHTSWLHANTEYEEGVARFVEAVLGGAPAAAFLASFVPFQRRLAWFGMIGSLSQLVLRLGAPGVPDVYQGSELWNLSMVDPDNRQPVDFEERAGLLRELGPLLDAVDEARVSGRGASPPAEDALRVLFENWHDGRVKLFTMAAALRLRRSHADLFLHGDYEPLGSDLDDPHLVAFSRRFRDQELVVAVPRFLATLLRGTPRPPFGLEQWRTASIRLPLRLAETPLVNVFTGERVDPVVYRDVPWLMAGSAFQSWPVAMLWAGQSGGQFA